ncbi:P27 family phage terminase small subunit [Thalassotalea sp. SU-HH00458]|uniref:P27 family phage terminase small subunit n=1 Tax=Thalassotalea sp. SU-HH00458 TaxID=3127657 RepID=UPI0031084100
MNNAIEKPDFIRSDLQINYFNQIVKRMSEANQVIVAGDEFAIGGLAMNLAIVDFATSDIATNGLIIESEAYRTGAVSRKANPAVNMLKDAQNNIRAYLTKLKLDPQSRGTSLLNVSTNQLSQEFWDKI